MTLKAENVSTKPHAIYPATIEADVSKMDRAQLKDYFAAVLVSGSFRGYPSIAFLPESAVLDPKRNFGHRIGHLYADSGNPETTEKYIDPGFRDRLVAILLGYLSYQSTDPEIIQGCIDVIGSIVFCDGENNLSDQVGRVLDSSNGKSMTLSKLQEELEKENLIEISSEHLQLLRMMKKLLATPGFKQKYSVSNVVLGQLLALK